MNPPNSAPNAVPNIHPQDPTLVPNTDTQIAHSTPPVISEVPARPIVADVSVEVSTEAVVPAAEIKQELPADLQNQPAPTLVLNPLDIPIPKNEAHEAVKKSQYFNNSIFWIESEKIVPNPYQPRKEFDAHALRDLAESIRMYGLLQPLVVTRKEIIKPDGGLAVQYELISGERRLRASKLAGLPQVPAIIRAAEEDARVKLELAIIENLQREDLSPLDRARSFERLASEFHLKHDQIAEKVGKSREYVSNTIRLLKLPPHMLDALSERKISEGHTRPLLMLIDRPEEQEVLFKEITMRKMTVREAERHARIIAVDRARKPEINPELRDLEKRLKDTLGTRVIVEKKEQGGKITIDFFNVDDVRNILDRLMKDSHDSQGGYGGVVQNSTDLGAPKLATDHVPQQVHSYNSVAEMMNDLSVATPLQSASAEADVQAGITVAGTDMPIDDSTVADTKEDEDLYSIKNFSI